MIALPRSSAHQRIDSISHYSRLRTLVTVDYRIGSATMPTWVTGSDVAANAGERSRSAPNRAAVPRIPRFGPSPARAISRRASRSGGCRTVLRAGAA